jgi:hypothetical protein
MMLSNFHGLPIFSIVDGSSPNGCYEIRSSNAWPLV